VKPLLAAALLAALASPIPPGMVEIPAGTYAPPFAFRGEGPVSVPAFYLDERPVSNGEYLAFVESHPEWARSQARPPLVDGAYLSHWAGDAELGPQVEPEQPVTFVSYFAAAAYCASVHKRLPSEAEWERAETPPVGDAEARDEAERRTLAFYSRPGERLPHAGATPPNHYGVRDLDGVIWEWNSDFASVLPPGATCGEGALGASDLESYTTFMRFAFRSSLEGSYAIHHLGFRCAQSRSAAGPAESDAASLLRQLSRDPALVMFFYTSCDSACPLSLAALQRVERALEPAAKAKLRFVLISLDAGRDSPERLSEFARERGLDPAHWTLLARPPEQLRALATALGVRYRIAGASAAHDTRLTLLGRGGQIAAAWAGPAFPVGEVAAAAARAVRD
jgi:formylglycine-generating enzyme required for sulfatase activity